MKIKHLLVTAASIAPLVVFAHGDADAPPDPNEDRRIEFPDTAGYLTLSVDLHTHSVFSDGHVWPRTRVEEALRDGLDALAITEHLEWQPHRADILNPDRNRSYEIATAAASGTELMIIAGSEITRQMPVGHINVVFLSDANALLHEPDDAGTVTNARDYSRLTTSSPADDVLATAVAQGGFVFWNHPDWVDQAPDGIARPTEFHLAAFANNTIHGIEVANGQGYSEEAFDIALEHNLALIGVSDIHELIDWDYEPHNGGHRPVTLVFAEDRSVEAIRAALFDRRTVVWYKNLLFGRDEHLSPLLDAILVHDAAEYIDNTETVSVTFHNRSDARLILENQSEFTFMNTGDLFEIDPHDSIELQVKTRERVPAFKLSFVVRNALTAPKQPAEMTFELPIAPAVAAH